MNYDPRMRADARQQPAQRVQSKRDTAGGRREAFACGMDEDRATAPGDARPGIVVDLDNEVVERVGAGEPVGAAFLCHGYRPVIAPVRGILAPAVVRLNPPGRQQGRWPRVAVGAPPQPVRMKAAARRRAVTLALVGFNAAASERHRQGQRTGDQPPLACPARPAPYPYVR